jgi:hypothetical protein
MKYLSIIIWSCCFLPVFSQNSPTVTLVFVSPANDSYKNYEAVIDDVSYYSENTSKNSERSSGEMSAVSRNTIWLNNFQPGKHTIQIYSVRNGSNNERAGSTPVYSSTFTVKDGFDTKIAVRSNGQLQFSERISTGNNNSGKVFESDNNIHLPGNNSTAANNTSGRKMNTNKNDNADINRENADKSTANSDENNDDSYNNGNTSANGRHSRKRIDTAIVGNDSGNNTVNTSRNNEGTDNNGGNSNGGFDDQSNDENRRASMNDNQFNQLYETIRNQWLPGQKMKTLSNEFLNAEDNFTTLQAKRLIQLVTEEGNRLKLAKSSYHCITDPENFSQLNDVFRYQTSRDELDDFIRNGQD